MSDWAHRDRGGRGKAGLEGRRVLWDGEEMGLGLEITLFSRQDKFSRSWDRGWGGWKCCHIVVYKCSLGTTAQYERLLASRHK